MRDEPAGLRTADLRQALAAGWRIGATAMRYAPVGGGSYHWVVRDGATRWFVTVDDLDDKPWLGATRSTAAAGLRAAMDTAADLRQAGLTFVAAPERGAGGATVQPVDDRYAATVFRFVRGRAGRFGAVLAEPERAAMVDLLAALHRATPAARRAAASRIGLPRRAELEQTLGALTGRWQGGPFAEPARALLAVAEPQIRDRLAAFDRLAEAARSAGPVITHGEPHPGNVLRLSRGSAGQAAPAGPGRVLVDWDTVGLGPPERDLWLVIGQRDGQARRYTELTGHIVDDDLLAFYRLRWALDDLSAFAARLRAVHGRTADAEHAWHSLEQTVTALVTSACRAAQLSCWRDDSSG
jgi:spectinomycin phosphotransferase